jgi:type II secretory pathway component HofQ
VAEGETVAIGGLMKDTRIETVTRVPLLGHIPVLGYLFSHRSTRNEKRDLIIFITPKLLAGGDGEG